jgi:hypothetical protein
LTVVVVTLLPIAAAMNFIVIKTIVVVATAIILVCFVVVCISDVLVVVIIVDVFAFSKACLGTLNSTFFDNWKIKSDLIFSSFDCCSSFCCLSSI